MFTGFISPQGCMLVSVLQVESKLAVRLQYGIRAWTEALEHEGKQMEDMDLSMDTDAPTTATHKPGGEPKFKV